IGETMSNENIWQGEYEQDMKLHQQSHYAEALKYNNLRGLTRQLNGQPPGAEGSFSKVASTELNARMMSFAMELLGSYAVLDRDSLLALDQGRWVYHTLLARAGLIGAGTSEIQRNIISERVLGLPKG
ncbi:MAG: acyl-CoA dehydrogenase family protein, partial [Candidatus Binatia bacterium]